MSALPVPCPVRLGVVRNGSLQAQLLHQYTLERNLHKIEKLLKKGVDVDCVNNLGQTPLFCASLLGLMSVTELLLQYGADPNHRCEDRSTPVHAAVFSCNPWLLSGLLDTGGDLRLHDLQGRNPQDWAEAGAQEHSARMLVFLKSCVSHMHSLSQTPQPWQLRPRTPSSTSSKTLVRSPSLLELLKSGGSDLHLNRKMNTKSSACDTVQCFGFGKLCIEKPGQALGLLASLPVIGDSELGQADDEPLLFFTCSSFITMTNYSWKGCRVTVKELQSLSSSQGGSRETFLDLLLIEQEYCSHLFHPHLLQLMAVSMGSDLLRVRLVFERVHVGSLYNLLHKKRAEFPVLRAEALLSVVLQVCEALLYLHGRALVMRSLSSHSVLLTHPGVAKLSGLSFMVPSEGSRPHPPPHLPLPPGLYNWAAPEVIRRRPCTGKADLYSLCALIQELYTDAVPWGDADPGWIRQEVDSGRALAPDPRVPQPYYPLVRVGLHPRAQERTHSLQDLRLTLRCDIKELSQVVRRRSGLYTEAGGGLRAADWSPESTPVDTTGLKPATHLDPEEGPSGLTVDTKVDREIHHQLSQLDRLLDGETETEEEGEREKGNRGEEGMTTDSAESISLHRDISFRDILPLDNWRMCTTAPSEPESTQEDESKDEDDEEEERMRERRAVQPERLIKSFSEHISSIVLNLKVSQVLLQQSQSNLVAVENGRHRRQLERGGTDEVDTGGANHGRDAALPSSPASPSTSASLLSSPSSSTLSGSACSTVSRAVGPPSQYRLLPHGVHLSAKRVEAQLLKGGESRPLSAQELAVWQREYPAEEHPALEGPWVGYAAVECPSESSGPEELSHYSSAQEDSFVNTQPRNKQQAGRGRPCRETEREREQQRADTQTEHQSHDNTEELTDRPYVSSEAATDSLEEDSPTPQPRLPQPPAKTKWTSEVSDLVARMTSGHLWPAAVGAPGSSDSEDMEDRQGQGQGLAQGPPRLRQDLLGRSDTYRPSPPASRAPQTQPAAEEASQGSSSELEHIFKSFAGVQNDSEEDDTDFHTVNRTFNMTCGVWEGAGPREEEGSSESDITQSPVEAVSMFYTPNTEQRNNQSPSSEEDVDVTVEVCRPGLSVRAAQEQTLEARDRECQPVHDESERMDTNPIVSEHGPFPLTSGLPDLGELADLSSITCSPAQHERLPPSPLNRRPPPCYSTPRSPVTEPHRRAMGGSVESVPPLLCLLDTSAWGSSRSLPPHTDETFATASLGASSTTNSPPSADHSVSSMLQSPSRSHSSSPEENDTPTAVLQFTTASSGEQQTTAGSSQEGVASTFTVPPTTTEEEGHSQDDEAQSMEYLQGKRGTRTLEEEEEGEMEGSKQSGSDDDQESEPLDASLSVAEEEDEGEEEQDEECEEEELPDEEELEQEDEDEDEEVTYDEEELLDGEEVSVGSLEQAEKVHSEDNLAGAGPDPVGQATPVQQSRARRPPEGPDPLEETDRAHSTLDEVLQGMLVEKVAGHRVLRSPGPVTQPPPSVCEPQGEGEVGEDAGCPAGDHNLPVPVAGDDKLETAGHGTWSKPHRVIILEQTPIKSQSGPNQVLRD